MADRNFSAHHVQQIVKIGAMHYVRQHRPVHFFVFGPVRAVHVGHVEIVTLLAPAFVENLFEFFFRVEIHPQVEVDSTLARRWWSSICVHDKERGSWRRATCGARTTSATTAGAIDKFVTVRADFVSHNTGGERSRSAIAKPVTN